MRDGIHVDLCTGLAKCRHKSQLLFTIGSHLLSSQFLLFASSNPIFIRMHDFALFGLKHVFERRHPICNSISFVLLKYEREKHIRQVSNANKLLMERRDFENGISADHIRVNFVRFVVRGIILSLVWLLNARPWIYFVAISRAKKPNELSGRGALLVQCCLLLKVDRHRALDANFSMNFWLEVAM